MKPLIKPSALKPGDTVATVSLSWGGAGLIPSRYEQGKQQFQDTFGVKIIEMPNSLKSPAELYDHPEWRLDDLMIAFKNPDIKAILTNIGGDDTIRLLRHMTDEHFEIIRNNPKIFLGMSDTTANHFMCLCAGISSFYSPANMYGYAENCGIPQYMIDNTKRALFSTEPIGIIPESKDFIIDMLRWGPETNSIMRPRIPATPWCYIQGDKPAQGRLLGGCTELMNMLNGTPLWPNLDEWNDTILFLENSEEKVSPEYVLYTLRNFGAVGILERINGILFARPGGEFGPDEQIEKEKWIANYPKFDDMILKACREYGRADIPIVTNMNFGHTLPQFILPYGAMTEINPIKKTVSILESAVE